MAYPSLVTEITTSSKKDRNVRAEMLQTTKLRIARLSLAPSAEPMGPAFPRTTLFAHNVERFGDLRSQSQVS